MGGSGVFIERERRSWQEDSPWAGTWLTDLITVVASDRAHQMFLVIRI